MGGDAGERERLRVAEPLRPALSDTLDATNTADFVVDGVVPHALM